MCLIMSLENSSDSGNGVAQIPGNANNISIFDIYNSQNYPIGDDYKEFIDYNIPLLQMCKDDEYFSKFTSMLETAFCEVSPEFVIYNAGADILSGDPVGILDVSVSGMKKRDILVSTICKVENIPLFVTQSGAYFPARYQDVSDSMVGMASYF